MNPACWLFRRRLDAYHDGELAPRSRARVAAHVARCEACRRELAGLGELQGALALEPIDLPERAWDAFWPQVRARLAAAQADPGARLGWQRVWDGVRAPSRHVLAPALAAAALAVLAVLAPWQRAPQAPSVSGTLPAGPGSVTASLDHGGPLDHVVIQSIETADPETPVMVYASPDSDVTVLWVFGLERTGV